MLRPRVARPRQVRVTAQKAISKKNKKKSCVKLPLLAELQQAEVQTYNSPTLISYDYYNGDADGYYYLNRNYNTNFDVFQSCYSPYSVWAKMLKCVHVINRTQIASELSLRTKHKLHYTRASVSSYLPLYKFSETASHTAYEMPVKEVWSSCQTCWPRSRHRLSGAWHNRTKLSEYASLLSSSFVTPLESYTETGTKKQYNEHRSLWTWICRSHNSNTDREGASLLLKTERTSANALKNVKDDGVLTEEKKIVLKMALQGASMFIGGKAGTGKSHLLREIVREMTLRGLRVAVTASTGVAALNINGNTFHSTFGVSLEFDSCAAAEEAGGGEEGVRKRGNDITTAAAEDDDHDDHNSYKPATAKTSIFSQDASMANKNNLKRSKVCKNRCQELRYVNTITNENNDTNNECNEVINSNKGVNKVTRMEERNKYCTNSRRYKTQEQRLSEQKEDEEKLSCYLRSSSSSSSLLCNNAYERSLSSSTSSDRAWFATETLTSFDVIVIDEVSMLHAGYLEALEVSARCARPHLKHLPFAGMQIIVSGDFMQLRPFSEKEDKTQINSHKIESKTLLAQKSLHTSQKHKDAKRINRKNQLTTVNSQIKEENKRGMEEERNVLLLPEKQYYDAENDRIICIGVERDREVIKTIAQEQKNSHEQKTRIKRKNKRERNCEQVSKTSCNSRTWSEPHNDDVRHPIVYYCDRPMYDSYAFRHYLLHLQLHVAARQVDDLHFLDDLNALRRGVLSHRLFYSALINKPVTNAIRLYATKRAVRHFNSQQMLELTGKEYTFTTRLLLGHSSHTLVDNITKHVRNNSYGNTNHKNYSHEISSSSSSSPSSFRAQQHEESNVLVLELYKTPNQTSYNNNNNNNKEWKKKESVFSKKVPHFRTWRSLIEHIALKAGIAKHELLAHEIPGNVYMRNKLRRVALRITNKSTERLFERQRLFEMLAAKFIKEESQSSSSSHGKSGWTLMRYRKMNERQLSTLARPELERCIRKYIMFDFLLQSKELKVGCRVMLLRNLNTKYVNGSLGTIVSFQPVNKCRELIPIDVKTNLHPCCFHARNNSTSNISDSNVNNTNSNRNNNTNKINEQTLLLERDHNYTYSDDNTFTNCKSDEVWESDELILPIVRMDHDQSLVAIPWLELELPAVVSDAMVTGKMWTMPLIPAYAFTVHKIQGITFDHPVLFDAEGMFVADHMVYVAASRVKKFEQLRMINLSPRMITVHRPSMVFCDQLADVCTAAQRWNTWRQFASNNLFIDSK